MKPSSLKIMPFGFWKFTTKNVVVFMVILEIEAENTQCDNYEILLSHFLNKIPFLLNLKLFHT